MTRPSRSCRSEPQGLDLPGPEHGSSSFHLAHFPFRWCSQNDPRLRAEGVRQTSFPFAPYSGSQGSKGIVSSASSSSVAAFERFGVGRAPEPIPRLNSTGSLESVSSAYASYAKSRNDAALAQRDCRKWLFSWFSSVILRPQLSGQPTIPTASGKFMQACRKDTSVGETGPPCEWAESREGPCAHRRSLLNLLQESLVELSNLGVCITDHAGPD